IVRFDNGDELGGRTLAYARSRYRGCYQGETIKWFVNEIEVVVNDDYDWYYGDGMPNSSQFDFETVMLHEIGHTQQLGHVINSNEVMHFAVGPGQQKRALSHIDTIGGIFVTDKSADEAVCGRELMERYDACCESMVAVGQPLDVVLCPDESSAQFKYEVDFAESWRWQVWEDEDWVDLTDGETYSGTDSSKLTMQRSASEEKIAEFRCIASNTCGESVISEAVRSSARDLQFSMTSQPASCNADGEINLDRTNTEGSFQVSVDTMAGTDGGNSFDTFWSAEETALTLAVAPGTYSVFVSDDDNGCSVDLGTITIGEPIHLELSAKLVQDVGCTGFGGQLQVEFNDHPEFETVLLSIDGGTTFERFSDALGLAVFENLDEGEYQVMGIWEDGTCPTTTDPVSIGRKDCPEDADTPEDEPGTEGEPKTEDEPDMGDEPEMDNKPETGDEPEAGNNPEIGDEPEMGDGSEENDNPETENDSELDDESKMNDEPESDESIETDNITLIVYPNPAVDRIYVKSDGEEIIRFQMFNSRGTLIQAAVAKKYRDDTFYMDIAHPQSGVYTLYMITNGKNVLRQIIVK
ncbi:MAG: T9SS type A sorting domain-containing protein, partial [Pricia sp.]